MSHAQTSGHADLHTRLQALEAENASLNIQVAASQDLRDAAEEWLTCTEGLRAAQRIWGAHTTREAKDAARAAEFRYDAALMNLAHAARGALDPHGAPDPAGRA